MLLTWNLLREKSQVSGLNMSFFFFCFLETPCRELYTNLHVGVFKFGGKLQLYY